MAQAIGVLIIDGQPLYRDGLRACLKASSALEIVGEAGNVAAALRAAWLKAPAVVLLDIGLDIAAGSDAIRRVKTALPKARVVVLTAQDDPGAIRESFLAGASGYLFKGASAEEISAAVRGVAQGAMIVSEGIPQIAFLSAAKSETPGAVPNVLTGREVQVLGLVVAGQASREIARVLRLSVRTVETHRARIHRKLGVRNTAALVRQAFQLGLVAPVSAPRRRLKS